MHASVIIPTYNEAELLPGLLSDLGAQRGIEFEVIVADAQSTDRTREIARAAGARVVEGGLPAVGRNAGAAVATGDVLVFLDADVRIPRAFLRRALSEMRAREVVAATCPVKPISRLSIDRLVHNFANMFVRMNERNDPHAPGYCILIRADVFRTIDGFDESLKLAEDHDLVSRASRHGPFRMLMSTFLRVSIRRYQKEGRIAYALKAIKVGLYRAAVGEIEAENPIVEYEFGDFSEDEARGARKMLRRIERALIKLDRRTTQIDERVLHGDDENPGAIEQLRDARDSFREAWPTLFEAPPAPGKHRRAGDDYEPPESRSRKV